MFICSFHYPITRAIELVLHCVVVEHETFSFSSLCQTRFLSQINCALQLLGSETSFQALEGVAMELEDSLFPLLREAKISIDLYEMFQDADWVLLIGAKPRLADLLDINILTEQFVQLALKAGVF